MSICQGPAFPVPLSAQPPYHPSFSRLPPPARGLLLLRECRSHLVVSVLQDGPGLLETDPGASSPQPWSLFGTVVTRGLFPSREVCPHFLS